MTQKYLDCQDNFLVPCISDTIMVSDDTKCIISLEAILSEGNFLTTKNQLVVKVNKRQLITFTFDKGVISGKANSSHALFNHYSTIVDHILGEMLVNSSLIQKYTDQRLLIFLDLLSFIPIKEGDQSVIREKIKKDDFCQIVTRIGDDLSSNNVKHQIFFNPLYRWCQDQIKDDSKITAKSKVKELTTNQII